MKLIEQLKKLFNITFAIYTCFAFAIMIFYKTSGKTGGVMWAWSDIEMMFGYILIFAAYSGLVITLTDIIPKLNQAARHVIKLALVYAGYFVWMKKSVPGVTSSQILIMTTLYVVVFAVVSVAAALLTFAEKKMTVKEPEYKSVFDNAKKSVSAEENTDTKKDGKKK
ncbi:MAG: hypothetical protein E7583_05940 [Ruminococcaceae bacterium]|nr:hypothetical protein [Oscillospiraceae bacterium]